MMMVRNKLCFIHLYLVLPMLGPGLVSDLIDFLHFFLSLSSSPGLRPKWDYCFREVFST